MSGNPGGNPGRGRGKKHRGKSGKGRGGSQQQQRQSESVPGGLQQRQEGRGARGGPGRAQQPPAEAQRPPQTPQAFGHGQQERPQQPSKQPRQKQQPRQQGPDTTDGAGPSKPQQQHYHGGGRPKTTQSQAQVDTVSQPSGQPSKTVDAPPAVVQPSLQPASETVPSETPVERRRSPPRSDRAVPKPPRRPDNGGTSGRPIALTVNFLPVKLPTNDVHHYDTEIKAKGKKSGEGYTKSEAPKIIQKAVELYEKENPHGPKLVFDRNGKNLYCKTLIPGIGKEKRVYTFTFMTENGKEQEFSVQIKWAAEVSLYYLNEALEGRHTEIPYDTMQAIEVVLRHLPSMRSISVRNSFFDYPTGREKDLGDGLQVWNGTFVSIRPTQWKMMLNVDTCSTAFYKAQPVVDFMCEFLNFRNYPRHLNADQRKKFGKEMKALKVETTHMKRKQKVTGLSVKSAREEMFDCEGKRTSVLEYFKAKYNITLEFPDLPCLKIGQKGSCIPIELCNVVDCQKKQGKLTGNQTQEMIRHTAIPAPDRMQKIAELIRKLRFDEDPYCRDFGISIGKQMATIQGRVLDAPVLNYGPANRPGRETPRDGTWRQTKPMFDPKEMREWALISYINEDPRKKRPKRYRGPEFLNDHGIENFVQNLVNVGQDKGLRINPNPCRVEIERGFRGTERLFGQLKASYPNIQLIIVVLPIDGDDFYEEVKHCGDVVHGINTQCIKVEQASSSFSNFREKETLVNLLLKINAKLGGTACTLDRGIKSPILRRPVIIFGADVTHPAAGDRSSPSIAAVVASRDPHPVLYNAEVRVQKHRVEMIEDLKDMVKTLMKKFRSATGAIPEKIIFYRDGVSEGQFRDVLLHELYAFQRACVELKDDYKPAITFIVVQKRHHARFFAVNPDDQRGKSRNIPAGTVVDKQVCHPYEYDWYLCSHAGIQGTSKPAHYHVLYDDSNFKSDDLQILTNQLCHTYVRCARSVSIPAPAYYAHHVAFRARHHLRIDSNAEGSVASGESESSDVTQEMKNLVTVHPNINCTMYFA